MNYNKFYLMQGFIIGSFFFIPITYQFTNIYINKHYILISKNLGNYIDTYKKYE